MKRLVTIGFAAAAILFSLLAGGCESSGRSAYGDTSTDHSRAPGSRPLSLNFTGDIMAHTVNYSMADYGNIYASIVPVLKSADLSFANLEIPVSDSLPLSTYPRFNVHTPYVRAAIDAGFNVFSLANNHSNDQGSDGIAATRSVLSAMQPEAASCGLRAFYGEPMKPVLIPINGKRILFLAVTEILNSYDTAGKLVYYVAPTDGARQSFLSDLSRMRSDNPCDVFVLSIHLNEPEYVRTVSASKRKWFLSIADAGVDIVWGHHPHVMQEWETISLGNGKDEKQVLFMYSMGNLISGQRYNPDRGNPAGLREYTGDGVILRVSFDNGKINTSAIPVTNYTDPQQGPTVRLFDKAFVSSVPVRWKDYYGARYLLMRSYLPLLPPMPVNAIIK